MRRKLSALVAWCTLAIVDVARAGGEPERVVVAVVISDNGDPLAGRLEAELRTLGFAVKTVTSDDATPSGLEAIARASHAAAAIHVVRGDQRAEVWVMDRVTGKVVLREVTVTPGEDVASVLTVRAVELLRASLLEIEAAHPSRGDVEVTETVRDVVRATHPPREPGPLSVAVGFGVQLAPSFSPAFHTLVAASWMPSRLGAELTALVPVSSSSVCATQGCTSVTAGTLGLGVRWVLVSREARVQPELGAGFAGAVIHAEGHATTPFVSANADAGAAAVYGKASLAIRVASQLRLGADVFVGAALPPVSIRFAGTEVAAWGGPFVSILVRLELSL